MENVRKNATGSQSRSAKEIRKEKSRARKSLRAGGDIYCTEKRKREAKHRERKTDVISNRSINRIKCITIIIAHSFLSFIFEFNDIYTPKSVIIVTLFSFI